MSYLDADEV
jgi:hypothetical protein